MKQRRMENQYQDELRGWPQSLANECWLCLGCLGSCMKDISGLSMWGKKGKHLPISTCASLVKGLTPKHTPLQFRVGQRTGPMWLRGAPGQTLEAPAEV